MNKNMIGKNFIDRDKLYSMIEGKTPAETEVDDILNKALKLKGLSLEDVAVLLRINEGISLNKLLKTAGTVKEEIYGRRLVIFAPLYIGNVCSNNCLYCGFRKDNKDLIRKVLSPKEIENEVSTLLKDGHKRLLMLCGESEAENPIDYFLDSIKTAYSVKDGKSFIRRINVEIAPTTVENFAKLKEAKIGTYVCFQETYDPVLYRKYHPLGAKANYDYRVSVMDRAMQGGVDDVGIGVLFGLADYRFEVLSIIEHAFHLEAAFGCGPHTVSVPRIEPASNAPLTKKIPHPVSDTDFKKIIAIIRIALPYTGIILSTRESEELREELFQYGISQISAGSRTNPGAYSETGSKSTSQFSLGDHRTLDEIISSLIEKKYIPSFCTGCYRKGRVGNDFMDLAKPGLIKEFCMPNALFTFKEYLLDYAKSETHEKGLKLIDELVGDISKKSLQEKMKINLMEIQNGERDIYF